MTLLLKEPRFGAFNSYCAVAAAYCLVSTLLFSFVAKNGLLAGVHVIGLLLVTVAYGYTRRTGDYCLGTRIILADGAFVVAMLFATGGWGGSGYIWTFGYLPFASLLTKRREAVAWLGALGLIEAGLAMFATALGVRIPYSSALLGNFFATYAVFIACVYLFHVSYDEYRSLAESRQGELEQRSAQLDYAQSIAKLGSFAWDFERDDVQWSKELFHIYGLPVDKVPKTYEEFLSHVHSSSKAAVSAALKKITSSGSYIDFYETIVRADGSLRQLCVRAAALRGPDGKLKKLTGTCRDVTDELVHEQELTRKNLELEQMNKLLVGRELKMVELKKEIEALKSELDRA